MIKKNLNGSSLSFPQDQLLGFEEESHTYTVKDVGVMTPVSAVIKKFFREFDAMRISLRKCSGNMLEAERLRDQWDAKGFEASLAGTHLHKQIEESINGKPSPELTCKVEYCGPHISLNKEISIAKEWCYYLRFREQTRLNPFRTEWAIYDVDARMAGTIDLLSAAPDGTYEIFDWKRSNKIETGTAKVWSYGINGLEHLPDTTYYHYCLQQNLYRYMLEKNYGLRVSKMSLVVLHPDYTHPRIVPVPVMEKEVAIIIRYLKNQ